jgi:hypothetical protein
MLGIISTISVNIQGIRINSDKDENTSWVHMRMQFAGIHSCAQLRLQARGFTNVYKYEIINVNIRV